MIFYVSRENENTGDLSIVTYMREEVTASFELSQPFGMVMAVTENLSEEKF